MGGGSDASPVTLSDKSCKSFVINGIDPFLHDAEYVESLDAGIGEFDVSERVREGLYRPPMGFAAAMTLHRAWSDATMPDLLTEMDCCSMASWMEVQSRLFILSNSSMR